MKTWTAAEWDEIFPSTLYGYWYFAGDDEYIECEFRRDTGYGTIDSATNPDPNNPDFDGRLYIQYRAYLPDSLTPLQATPAASTANNYKAKFIIDFDFTFKNCSFLQLGFWGYGYPDLSRDIYAATDPDLYGTENAWLYDRDSYIYTTKNVNGGVQLGQNVGASYPNRMFLSQGEITTGSRDIHFGRLAIAIETENEQNYGSPFGIILPITNDGCTIELGGHPTFPEYNGGEISETGGGNEGTFSAPSDNRGDNTGTTVLNIFTAGGASSVVQKHNAAIYGNGINVFKMDAAAVGQMVRILYGGNFIDKWLQAMYNPLSSILAVHMIPAVLCPLTYNGGTPPQINVTAGGYNFFYDPPSEIGQLLPQARVDTICVNHIGSFDFQKYFDAYPDFAPYTQVYLHLPYCGVLQIDTNAVMHGYISVDYVCDIMNGNVCAYVTCSDRDGRTAIKYTATGNAAYTIPMFAENQSGVETGKLLSSVVGGALMAATGNPAGFAAAGAELVGASIAGVQHNTQITGSISGNVGMITDTQCVLEIIRPQWVNPAQYAALNAIPIEIGGTISDMGLIGKTVIDKIELDSISCTDAEKIEIAEILESGIYIADEE